MSTDREPAAEADLVALLDLERIEDDIYRGRSPQTGRQRIFGGQVAAQALVAAGRTVPGERSVHSLHAYFLVAGDTSVPVLYMVDRIRDGRSFTTRRVVAVQHGRAIFHLSASFQVAEDGIEHADPMPDVPGPEGLPTMADLLEPYPDLLAEHRARRDVDVVERRYLGRLAYIARGDRDRGGDTESGVDGVWFRIADLPDDPLVHVCAVTYASDLTLLDSVIAPHGISFWQDRIVAASLDHAMWFHRPVRADEWLLYAQHSPAARGGRGLATGRIFDRTGDLLVSVVQEGLVRRPHPGS